MTDNNTETATCDRCARAFNLDLEGDTVTVHKRETVERQYQTGRSGTGYDSRTETIEYEDIECVCGDCHGF